jgi:hypothetical protein
MSSTEIAALEQLEAERERRIEEKIQKGLAVRRRFPIVVGVPRASHDYSAVVQGPDGIEIYPPKPAIIITGVPRAGRD